MIDGYPLVMHMSEAAGLSTGRLPTTGAVIPMADGSDCVQFSLPRPKQPFAMGKVNYTFGFLVTHLEDLRRIHRAGRTRRPVLAYLGLFHEDEWLIANADAGQTEWRTSRRIGWNGTTRTHVTHPPGAWITTGETTVEQTVVTSAPGVGEIRVPTSQTAGQYYDSLTSPANLEGDTLRFEYWPEILCRISVEDQFQAFNHWELAVNVEELLMGDYA